MISLFPVAACFCASHEPSKSRKACHACEYLLIFKQDHDFEGQNLTLEKTVEKAIG